MGSVLMKIVEGELCSLLDSDLLIDFGMGDTAARDVRCFAFWKYVLSSGWRGRKRKKEEERADFQW